MHLVLSRKGFDTASGGCPSPIFPDGSMIALPIPDKSSPVRYQDLIWRGRNLGDVVETLTRGKQRRTHGAHLDPDLRTGLRPRHQGWKPLLGQRSAAQGHLRNHGIGPGDLFLFWGLFRRVDSDLRWDGPPLHVIWGWLQVDVAAPVDATVRAALQGPWCWAADHPHLSLPRDPSNTLYVAKERVTLPGFSVAASGGGVFETFANARQLTAPGSRRPGMWKLPLDFMPGHRAPLSYHSTPRRWARDDGHVLLEAVSRGQEFVLDATSYPGVMHWVATLPAS